MKRTLKVLEPVSTVPRISLKGTRLVACSLAATAFLLAIAPAEAARKLSVQPITLYAKHQRSDTFDGCADLFPNSEPVDVTAFGPLTKGLCSDHFAVVYSGLSKTPLLAIEKLNRQSLQEGKGLERSESFFPDPRLKAEHRSETSDFTRKGFDRGHLASAANSPTPNAMLQTFALSNIIPQSPGMNRGVWSRLESDTRKFVNRSVGDVFVYTGVLFITDSPTVIGKNQVIVPTHVFKVVYHPNSGKNWAHVLPNSDDAELSEPIGYGDFVRKYGVRFIPVLDGTSSGRANTHSYIAD